MIHRYRAATAAGAVVEGEVDAPSQKSALDELRRQQLYPIELVPVIPEKQTRARSTGRAEALAVLARTLAAMLTAGATLERAVSFASAQATHAEVAEAGRQVNEAVRGGASLSEALSRHADIFGSLFVAMAAAGEESGALDEAMAHLADHLDESSELRAQIRSSLIYPSLMALASGLGIIVLLLFVVPRFVTILEGEGGSLPLSTSILVFLSGLLVKAWWLIALLAVAAFFTLRSWLQNPENQRRFHAWRLTLPLIGQLEWKYATARFTRALGMLLRSGRPILPALRVARGALDNRDLAAQVDRAAEAVSHGQRVSVALSSALPPLAAELIAVGEESGRLEELSLQIARAYDAEVRRSLRAAVAIIEPALILFFGLIVGFVALAMLQAIYSVSAQTL